MNFESMLNRIYDSPAALNANPLNESANASLGGCFNNYSSSNQFNGPRSSNGFGTYQPTSKMPNWRTSTPRRRPDYSNQLKSSSLHLRLVDLNLDESASFGASSINNSSVFTNGSHRSMAKSTLPAWAVDTQGSVGAHVTLRDVLTNNALFEFASDKNGCRFLQEQFPEESDGGLHDEIFRKIVEDRSVFLSMCRNMFGNFFIQRIVECSKTDEQEVVMEHLMTEMFALCMDKSACRVIQLAIQKLDVHLASRLALQLQDTDLVHLSIDQNGNHVIQKIIKTLPVSAWDYVIDYFCNDVNLISVCQDKYGCRVIQSTIEKLSENPALSCYEQRVEHLNRLMERIAANCGQLASNEFANYVIQHVIKSGGAMESYRDEIIEKCLLRNLLSMSQEKYASHVVEVAFLCAPHRLLTEMMEEIFEGYIPHPETNRDALDILLFHQYGNYVIQQMIHICCSAILGNEYEFPSNDRGYDDHPKKYNRIVDAAETELYYGWLERIKERVYRNSTRLERFSSGKKIIEALNNAIPKTLQYQ